MKRATTSTNVQKLQTWIRGMDAAMLTTEDRSGRLHSRPMIVLDDVSDNALWFVSDASSPKVDDIQGHHQVNISYADSAANRFVSVSGRARVLRDKSRMQELWNAKLASWFPKGPEDPELVLLRIEVFDAELWQSPRQQIEVNFAVESNETSMHEHLTFA